MMRANDLATGRNWYTADTAKLFNFSDCARWELHWNDGAMVSGIEDTHEDAVKALRRYGFKPKEPSE